MINMLNINKHPLDFTSILLNTKNDFWNPFDFDIKCQERDFLATIRTFVILIYIVNRINNLRYDPIDDISSWA